MAVNPGTYGLGAAIKQVKIKELFPGKFLASCIDTDGQYLSITTAIHRTGITPLVGQTWLVDRTYGMWSFAAWVELPT